MLVISPPIILSPTCFPHISLLGSRLPLPPDVVAPLLGGRFSLPPDIVAKSFQFILTAN